MGPATSPQIGSVSTLKPAIWISTVAWLISVTRNPETRRGGAGAGGASTNSGHGPWCRFSLHETTVAASGAVPRIGL